MNYELPFSLTAQELSAIDDRIAQFKSLRTATPETWFSELCFCLLTANAKATTALAIQDDLGLQGFMTLSQPELAQRIKEHKHRFHTTKSKYIVKARPFVQIKTVIEKLDGHQAREFLVKNISGLGYKESSHFLRNVGFSDVAIVDRHILRFLARYNYSDMPAAPLTAKRYLSIETELKKFGIALDKLDLMIWYHMTGTLLK